MCTVSVCKELQVFPYRLITFVVYLHPCAKGRREGVYVFQKIPLSSDIWPSKKRVCFSCESSDLAQLLCVCYQNPGLVV